MAKGGSAAGGAAVISQRGRERAKLALAGLEMTFVTYDCPAAGLPLAPLGARGVDVFAAFAAARRRWRWRDVEPAPLRLWRCVKVEGRRLSVRLCARERVARTQSRVVHTLVRKGRSDRKDAVGSRASRPSPTSGSRPEGPCRVYPTSSSASAPPPCSTTRRPTTRSSAAGSGTRTSWERRTWQKAGFSDRASIYRVPWFTSVPRGEHASTLRPNSGFS